MKSLLYYTVHDIHCLASYFMYIMYTLLSVYIYLLYLKNTTIDVNRHVHYFLPAIPQCNFLHFVNAKVAVVVANPHLSVMTHKLGDSHVSRMYCLL